MSALAELVGRAARSYGVDPNVLMRIGQIESGLNPNAKNPRSSAGGLFQFIDSTAQRYGLANKFDPAASADAAARLTRDNAGYLAKVLGRQPTGPELYLAHQQGAGGAAKILANPAADAASVVGGKAVALNGGRPGMTAGEFANLWATKFGDGKMTMPPGTNGDQAAPSMQNGTVPVLDFGDVAAAAGQQNAMSILQAEALRQAADAAARKRGEETERQARRRALYGGGVASLYG